MNKYQVRHSADIPASAKTVYDILCDYHVGHPAILPPEFEKLTVLEGGYGDGTVMRLDSNIMGNKQSMVMSVEEVEPGRKLLERSDDGSIETTFLVEPISAESCRVTLHTDGETSASFSGRLMAWLSPLILRRMYRRELDLLAQYVTSQTY